MERVRAEGKAREKVADKRGCRERCAEKYCEKGNGFAALCEDQYWICLYAECQDDAALIYWLL